MGRTLTNNLGLTVAKEATPGVLPGSPIWKQLEPNDITNFGPSFSSTQREPITRDRSDRKPTITDLDSTPEYEADLTMDIVDDFIAGFCFVVATNADLFFTGSDAAAATGFTVPALNATQAGKLQAGALLYSRGYTNTGNNGLFEVDVSAVDTDTEISVTPALVDETAGVSPLVEIAGFRGTTGDLTLTVSGTTAVLGSTTLDFTTLGLTVGQFIHVGGVASANQFASGAGYARITSIATNAVGLDKLATNLATDTGAGLRIDILYGQFIRNVSTASAEYVEQTFQFEGSFPNLEAGGATGYEYSLSNLPNQIVFAMPLTDKAGVTVSFVGTDTDDPVTTQKSGADTPREALKTAALNTSSDIGRLRVTDIDETGLTTDFKEINLTINNNVSAEKILGCLGAAYLNTGNFQVSLETTCLFSNSDVLTAIRENRRVTFDALFNNDDGSMILDIPSMTLGDGAREYPVNESITIALTGTAYRDPILGTSLGVSLFPNAPDVVKGVVN